MLFDFLMLLSLGEIGRRKHFPASIFILVMRLSVLSSPLHGAYSAETLELLNKYELACRQLLDEVYMPPLKGPVKSLSSTAQSGCPSSSNALLPTILFESERETPANPLLSQILQTQDYSALLPQLAQLEESLQCEDETFINYDPILEQILEHYKEAPHPEKILALIDKCRFALSRNTRLRVVLEYFFLSAPTIFLG